MHDALPDDYPYGAKIAVAASDSATSKSESPSQHQRSPVGEVVLLAACGLFNLAVFPLISAIRGPEPVALIGIAFGTFAAELGVLSGWLVLGNWPWWSRLSVHWVVLGALFGCFLIGLATTAPNGSNFFEVARAMLCGLPLVALAVQLPLWGLRTYFCWRIERNAGSASQTERPLSIGDMLIATVVAALSVAAARLASDDPEFFAVAWIAWAIAVPSIAAVSWLSLPIVIQLTLRMERSVLAAILLWAYASIAIIITLMAMALVNPGGLRMEEVIIIGVSIYWCGGLLWGVLMAARRHGYRLLIGRAEVRTG